jgi:hypothetical protein
MSTDDILRSFTYEQCKQFIGQTFQVRFEDGTIDLLLDSVHLLVEKHVSPQMLRDTFSLQFRGPGDRMLKQGMFAVYNESIGEVLPIFLVPLGREADGFLYEAVFN